MADYDQPAYVTKRLRYYDNQFLLEQDFIDEQKHTLDRQRRHDRFLHAPGIADGLEVIRVGKLQVSVAPGTAVDARGRHILLAAARVIDLPKEGTRRLYMRFRETETDVAEGEGVSSATRFIQDPEFFILEGSATGEEFVLLAEVTMASGDVRVATPSARVYAGVRLPGSAAGLLLRSSADGKTAELTGGLSIQGALRAQGITSTSTLTVGEINVTDQLIKLDKDKLDKTGGSLGGNLEVKGALSVSSLKVNDVNVGDQLVKLDKDKLDKTGGTLTNGLTINSEDVVVGVNEVMRATGKEHLRIVRGSIKVTTTSGSVVGALDKDSTKGKGFQVERLQLGIYEITFNPIFVAAPTLVACQSWSHPTPSNQTIKEQLASSTGYPPISTLDNVVILAVNKEKALIKTGKVDGQEADRSFDFIAIGW